MLKYFHLNRILLVSLDNNAWIGAQFFNQVYILYRNFISLPTTYTTRFHFIRIYAEALTEKSIRHRRKFSFLHLSCYSILLIHSVDEGNLKNGIFSTQNFWASIFINISPEWVERKATSSTAKNKNSAVIEKWLFEGTANSPQLYISAWNKFPQIAPLHGN